MPQSFLAFHDMDFFWTANITSLGGTKAPTFQLIAEHTNPLPRDLCDIDSSEEYRPVIL